MRIEAMGSRREFLIFPALAPLVSAEGERAASGLKIGHRQANMAVGPGPEVFDLARRIPGLSGIELQVHFKGTTLWDRETLMAYRRSAERAGLKVPSLAGIWTRGASILQPVAAEQHIRKAIQAAEDIGAAVILVAAFGDNCPNMQQEPSYAPVVSLLQKLAPFAAGAGVTICLETSLSPSDDSKLIDLVGHANVRVYYDLDNCEWYGHKGQAIPGIAKLGRARIGQVHLKNEDRLLEEPGRVDWKAALAALKQIGYDGWLVFESSHPSPEHCIAVTTRNITFIERYFA